MSKYAAVPTSDNTFIQPTMTAATRPIYLRAGQSVRVSIRNFGAGEVVTFDIPQGRGASRWTLNGSDVELSATHNAMTLTGPGVFIITKPVTQAEASVHVDE
jgi:hypothetical protein